MTIPYGRQEVTDSDIDAVVQVLRSDFLTQGSQVSFFEAALAQYCGAAYGVAVNSATSALHVACSALGLGKGDWLWTTPITFVASANCARYCGASVDFVDIDPDTINMSTEALRAKLVAAAKTGRLPKVVVPVHMAGHSCDMKVIHELGQQYGFRIIEDASHAIGGAYSGDRIGCGRYSDITVFSFHPVKIITTGEGGMAVTNDAVLAKRMELLRSHGITRELADMTKPPDGPWYYQQVDLGFNYRMTELQAALGLSQLKRLDQYVTKRNCLADRYDKLLGDLPLRTFRCADYAYSSYHLYIIRIEDNGYGNRNAIFNALRAEGIGVNVHYIPVHTQPYYAELGREIGYDNQSFPHANDYYQHAITLPLFVTLTESQQDRVVQTLNRLLA
jgi:UDP-4-amino-4,6-dideoxy-N-acetyl-beta-L-altrosamine transaminase